MEKKNISTQQGAHEHTPAQTPVSPELTKTSTIPESIYIQPSEVYGDDDDDEEYVPVPTATLPVKDKDLPCPIREIVSNAPVSKKIPAFIASLAPLCALATRVRTKYYHDTTRQHALLIQVAIEGAQSAGKSFTADIEGLIMNDTLKARDKAQRRMEQEYREKKKRRGANEKLEEEPRTTIRVIPATISKTVLTKRADFHERITGDTTTFWMFSEELSQVTDAGKQGYSNLRTIMRSAYDLGSLFGIDYASDNSYSAIVDINICSLVNATPAALDEYYDKKSIEGGNITRCILCPISDNVEDDNELFRPYTDDQMQSIRKVLDRMMDDTYDENDTLKPTIQVDMSWIDRDCKRYIKRKAKEFSLTGSEAIKVFRKRSSVSAFRCATLFYYLYSIEMGFDPTTPIPSLKDGMTELPEVDKKKLRAQKLCRKLYQFLAEFIIENMLRRWGKKFNELNKKRYDEEQTPDKQLFKMLTPEFTRDQLKLLIKELGCTTPAKQFIWMWGPKKMNVIEVVDKNHFRKKEG